MQQNTISEFIRRNGLLLTFIAIILFVLFVVGQYGFISINVTPYGSSGGNYHYYITNNKDGTTSEKISNVPVYKKLVRRSSYTVTTTQNETSYFSIVNSGRFFFSTKVDARMVPEKSRTFVGDNPDACTLYTNVLMSYSCNGLYKTLKIHRPATATHSTYVDTASGSGDTIEGIVKGKEGTVALFKISSTEGDTSPQLLTPLDSNGKTSVNGVYVPNLNSSDSYHLSQFKDGYAIYDDSMSDVVYLSSMKSNSEKITFETPKDKTLEPYIYATTNDSIVAAFTADRQKSVSDNNRSGVTVGTTTVSVFRDGKTKQFTIDGVFSSMLGCGTQKLCVVSNRNLQIYDISGKKPKLLYSIPNVQGIANNGNSLVVATGVNLLDLDVDKRSGSVAYSFSDYTFCGLTGDSSGYTLCVINPLNRKVALRFDPNSPNTDSIDKKILDLQDSTSVKIVSIYGNNIAVVPNYGELVSGPGGFKYDDAVVKRMNETFKQDLAKSGIDTSKYAVTGLQ